MSLKRHVFLIHSLEDREHPTLRRLLKDLRPHFGFESGNNLWAFMDTEDGKPRDDFLLKKMGVIPEPDFVILVLSQDSSQSSWALQEFTRYYDLQNRYSDFRVLPVVMDITSLPPFLGESPIVDLAKDYIRGLEKILWSVNLPLGESIATFDVGTSRDSTKIIGVSGIISEKLIEYYRSNPEELRRIDRRQFE